MMKKENLECKQNSMLKNINDAIEFIVLGRFNRDLYCPVNEKQEKKLKSFLPIFKKIKSKIKILSVSDDRSVLEFKDLQSLYNRTLKIFDEIRNENTNFYSKKFDDEISKMKTVKTSGDGLFCGTHSIGHSIYIHWDEISDNSKDKVLKAFNKFYEKDFNCVSLKKMLDALSNRDIQWILAQVLDNLIKNGDFYYKTPNFYKISVLLQLAISLDIPIEIITSGSNYSFKMINQFSPIIAIKLHADHYESLVDEVTYSKISARSVKDQLAERDKKTVQDFISNLVNEEALRKNIQNLQYEIEKRLNSTRVIYPEKKAFYEATKAQLEKMLESLEKSPSITEFLEFKKVFSDLSSHKFLENDKSFYALLKKILEFICKVIDWLSSQVIDTYEYVRSTVSSFSAG